jgi:hypothetical protein
VPPHLRRRPPARWIGDHPASASWPSGAFTQTAVVTLTPVAAASARGVRGQADCHWKPDLASRRSPASHRSTASECTRHRVGLFSRSTE